MFYFGKPTIKDVITITDLWFNSIEGVQGDEVITTDFGRLIIHLVGSADALRNEFERVHGVLPPDNAYGMFHGRGSVGLPEKAVYHLYVRFKRDSSGVEYIAPWALQHELHHAIDNWLYLARRDEDMSNPDTLI